MQPINHITYNGKTLEDIKTNFPKTMPQRHKDLYISNCIEVHENEQAGTNKGLVECLRNQNFHLTQLYLNQ